VLEAILELPFARDSGLCTRFATQITMRCTAYESIVISIIPGPACSAGKAEKLRSFKKEGLTSLTGKDFLDVFEEVSEPKRRIKPIWSLQIVIGMCCYEYQPSRQGT
jgi:hypothetical protein